MPRKSLVKRKTKETEIEVKLNIDGKGRSKISGPIPFMNHLLACFSKHGVFDLSIRIRGDIETGQHHTVEDVGICLGQAFKKALGNKKGINRAGYFVFPLDEALSVVAVDISGRAFFSLKGKLGKKNIGGLDISLLKEFFWGFVRGSESTLHVRAVCGEDDHHKAESMFKAFGKAMKTACSRDKRILKELPTTKGLL